MSQRLPLRPVQDAPGSSTDRVGRSTQQTGSTPRKGSKPRSQSRDPRGSSKGPRATIHALCVDGTGQDGVTAVKQNQPTSAMHRYSEMINTHAWHPTKRLRAYYQPGPSSGLQDKDLKIKLKDIPSAATGKYVTEGMRQAYKLLSDKFHSGDQLLLMGFSRGGHVVRCLVNFIYSVGGLLHFKDGETEANKEKLVFELYERWRDLEGKRMTFTADEEKTYELTPDSVFVEQIVIFDPVPAVIDLANPWHHEQGGLTFKQLTWVDSTLDSNVRYAEVLVAIQEHRGPFEPILITRVRDKKTTKVKHMFFGGVHINIGGGGGGEGLERFPFAYGMARIHVVMEIEWFPLLDTPVDTPRLDPKEEKFQKQNKDVNDMDFDFHDSKKLKNSPILETQRIPAMQTWEKGETKVGPVQQSPNITFEFHVSIILTILGKLSTLTWPSAYKISPVCKPTATLAEMFQLYYKEAITLIDAKTDKVLVKLTLSTPTHYEVACMRFVFAWLYIAGNMAKLGKKGASVREFIDHCQTLAKA